MSFDRVHLDVYQLVTLPLQEIKNFFGSVYETKYSWLDKVAEQLTKQISDLDMSNISYGIIAGDMHGYNQHFDENNQLTMFDFEFCAYGYRIYDIATFRWSRGSENIELWNYFLSGYQTVRELSKPEIQAIDVFVKARNLWWMKLSITFPDNKSCLNSRLWDPDYFSF